MRIQTDLQIATRLTVSQLKHVNNQTIESPLLEKIIEEIVPEQGLTMIGLRGLRGDEIHARTDINIRYDADGPQYDVAGDTNMRFTSTYGEEGGLDRFGTPKREADCPVWREALLMFMQIIQERGLQLAWAVRFCHRHEEYRRRYGLVPSFHRDCTINGKIHTVPNSLLTNMFLEMRYNLAV